MIYFDATKTGSAAPRSGLTRVSTRLAEELGPAATPVAWPRWNREARSEDWYFTAELFSESERPGLGAFLHSRRCRAAAIFHDAIPLQHPHITWPQSVARHPGYMKLLARFDRVFAVSAASKRDLEGFWRWQGVGPTPPVDVIALGADFNRAPRITARPPARPEPPQLMCVGILEPRKNQLFLLGVCELLWTEGLPFTLNLFGRVNPHFGAPIVARIRELSRRFPGAVRWRQRAGDEEIARSYALSRATVFPTKAEGCGLPLLESLWQAVPCVCSDLSVLCENADGGGCLPVPVSDRDAWVSALRRILTDDVLVRQLTTEAATRPLPTWHAAADVIRGL